MSTQSTITFLFFFVGSAAARGCNLCYHSSNEFNSVPKQNAGLTVSTSMGRLNCAGLHEAGMNGIFSSWAQCREMASEFAPTCCNLSGRRDMEVEDETVKPAEGEAATIDTIVKDESETTEPKDLLEEEMKGDQEQELRDLSAGRGRNCNLCKGGSLNNPNGMVRTSMGLQNCGVFFETAMTQPILTQNQCNAISAEFAPTCCSRSSRGLRGGN